MIVLCADAPCGLAWLSPRGLDVSLLGQCCTSDAPHRGTGCKLVGDPSVARRPSFCRWRGAGACRDVWVRRTRSNLWVLLKPSNVRELRPTLASLCTRGTQISAPFHCRGLPSAHLSS
jgi:hypothetical protein